MQTNRDKSIQTYFFTEALCLLVVWEPEKFSTMARFGMAVLTCLRGLLFYFCHHKVISGPPNCSVDIQFHASFILQPSFYGTGRQQIHFIVMKRFSLYVSCLAIGFSLLMLSACDGITNDAVSGYAPESVTGKTFDGWAYFTSSSTFSYDVGDKNQIIGTPTYTYRKTGDNTALLTLDYVEKHVSSVSNMNYTEEVSYSYNLHFTSKEAGWGTGTLSIKGLPSFMSYDPSIEYMDFTLLDGGIDYGNGSSSEEEEESEYTIESTKVWYYNDNLDSQFDTDGNNLWYKWTDRSGTVYLCKSKTDFSYLIGEASYNYDSSRGGNDVSDYTYRIVDDSKSGWRKYYYFN